jgi:hypothetical protein
MSSTIENKISSLIQTQLPEFIQSDHSTFIEFLKYYYQFLESGKLTIDGSVNHLKLETISESFLLDQNSEKVVLEDSLSKYIVGEFIIGSQSKARAKILVDDYNQNSCLFITSQQLFIPGETITGETTGSTSVVSSYQANPVQNIQQFINYVDVDYTVTEFLNKFRDAYMESIPNVIAAGISKRTLIKNIKDLYTHKGTLEGHKLFFKILLDEDVTVEYPKDNILRASDGNWSSDKIMRIIEVGNSNFNNLEGQIIEKISSSGEVIASATIVTVVKFVLDNNNVVELSLDPDSIVGNFETNDIIRGLNVDADVYELGIVQSILSDISIESNGFNYSIENPVYLIGGDSTDQATSKISLIGSGGITDFLIEDGGEDYEINDLIVFDENNTEGKDALARVSVVGGSFLLENSTDPFNIITEDNNYLVFEDNLYIQYEENLDNDDYLLQENGEDYLIIESETLPINERGKITKIKIFNSGNGYTSLPRVSSINTTNGNGAKLVPLSTKFPGIGHVKNVDIVKFGLQYQYAPVVNFLAPLIVKNVNGTFERGSKLTNFDGEVYSYDSALQLLVVRSEYKFSKNEFIQTDNASATIYFNGTAEATASLNSITNTVGNFVDDKGKLSNDFIKLQDSYYYQDFSYVVKLGQSINLWREALKRSVHPAGWNFFGEILLTTKLNAKSNIVRFVDEVIPIIDFNLFYDSTIIGRRLGTVDDSSLAQDIEKGKKLEDLLSGQRDLTLSKHTILRLNKNRNKIITKGYTLADFVKFSFAVPPIITDEKANGYFDKHSRRITYSYNNNLNADSYYSNISKNLYSIEQFKNYKINSVSDYVFLLHNDGDRILLEDSSGSLLSEIIDVPQSAYTTRTNIPSPSQISIYGKFGWVGFDNLFLKTTLQRKSRLVNTIIESVDPTVETITDDFELESKTILRSSLRIYTDIAKTYIFGNILSSGATLDNLEKYAFVEPPLTTTNIRNYHFIKIK